MLKLNRAASVLVSGLSGAALTAVPLGRLRGRHLAVTAAMIGATSAALAMQGARLEARRAVAPAAEKSGAAATCVGLTAGALSASGFWVACATDRFGENWLRRRGMSHPRPWLMLVAGLLGSAAESLEPTSA